MNVIFQVQYVCQHGQFSNFWIQYFCIFVYGQDHIELFTLLHGMSMTKYVSLNKSHGHGYMEFAKQTTLHRYIEFTYQGQSM